VIVQNSNNSTVVEAANALFNKHPDTSIIVKFDQNGNLVTLKGETYTPTSFAVIYFTFYFVILAITINSFVLVVFVFPVVYACIRSNFCAIWLNEQEAFVSILLITVLI
jgi:hypothetical protein